MSGTMDWAGMYAAETCTGHYTAGGTPKHGPGGLERAATNGGGPCAWDMDWSWGSEAIPLEYCGFKVAITDLGGGQYGVSLTPAPVPEPGTLLLIGTGVVGILGYSKLRIRRKEK